jgi:D-beta-D-heptose 7-phosphate kinase/D-beta-D-heptose 1-phosphate adenosyltransferase
MPPPKQFKVSLIGDDGIDEYQYGTIDRLSAEAPVPVFKYKKSVLLPGMAANVRKNLENLGVEVVYHCGEPSYKTRILDEKSKHHVCRIDRDASSNPLKVSDVDLNVDAIVISDYNKGSVSYELIQNLRRQYSGPIFIDTKKPNLAAFIGCFVKVNEPEHLARWSDCPNLIVTRGSNSVLFYVESGCEEFPVEPVEAFDVCGAGDTFLAAMSYKYLESDDIRTAIKFAIKAASVTIQHIGVYAPTLEEINGDKA